MGYKQLFLFVEGDDDRRFIENLVIPHIKQRYDYVKPVEYAKLKENYIINFITSIKAMNADYIFFVDIDSKPCITSKKEIKIKKYNLAQDKIFIVVKEIEGWYLAGLEETDCNNLGISIVADTNEITKEKFNELIPNKFVSRIDFMTEILKNFSIETAKTKNASFKYFAEKFL